MVAQLMIVDDDDAIRDMLTVYLEGHGFKVSGARSAEEADRLLAQSEHQLILLDIMMPGTDGLSFCRRIRQAGDPVGIILLTARRHKLDRIIGLEIGADDYVCKPFDPRELLARIGAVLRRYGVPAGADRGVQTESSRYCFGDCCVDLDTRQLYRENRSVPLTNAEFELLKTFILNQGRSLSRDELMQITRGRSAGPFDRTIDVLTSRLRRLVEPDPNMPRYIQTVRGHGYRFVPD